MRHACPTPASRVTDRAAARIAEIAAAERRARRLRVAVLAGGCSGFQYKFDLDSAAAAGRPGDRARPAPACWWIPASLDLLAGAELDYKDELMGSYFAVRNPERHQRLRLRHQLLDRLIPRPCELATWNVNGIRAREKNVLRWLERATARYPAAAGNQVRGARVSRDASQAAGYQSDDRRPESLQRRRHPEPRAVRPSRTAPCPACPRTTRRPATSKSTSAACASATLSAERQFRRRGRLRLQAALDGPRWPRTPQRCWRTTCR